MKNIKKQNKLKHHFNFSALFSFFKKKQAQQSAAPVFSTRL